MSPVDAPVKVTELEKEKFNKVEIALVMLGVIGVGESANFERIEEDSQWLNDNFDTLKKELEGKVFAVKERRIIAAEDNIVILIKKLTEMGENPEEILIESIPPPEVGFIL